MFFAGCCYNEEDISRHFGKSLGYWPVQINDNKFANRSNYEKTGRSCEGADFSWLSSKVSQTLHQTLRPSGSSRGIVGHYVEK
jgi:hypothetical protein